MMSLVIFVPTVFALVLMIIPRLNDEFIRWWSLFGTAATLVLSICMFISFYDRVVDANISDPPQALLNLRVDKANSQEAATGPRASQDWVARYPWIERFHIDYFLGADGIRMALVLLTTGLSFLAMIASWNINRYVRGYCILFLILETGMIGTFLALDFFLFYIFWEIMLLPMYFLIGVWGGPRREYAAIKFFLYTLFGSVLILIAMLGLYFSNISYVNDFVTQSTVRDADGRSHLKVAVNVRDYLNKVDPQANKNLPVVNSFDFFALQKAGKMAQAVLDLQSRAQADLTSTNAADAANARKTLDLIGRVQDSQPYLNPWFQYTMFILLMVGFAIKVPVFPFHTWLPDAHVEAPTPISMILAGVLLKMGGYGILAIAYPIFPWAAEALAWGIGLFGIINIVYGAFAAMAQTDFKKLVAYSSVSHMGYVILGIAVWSATGKQYWSWAMNGAMFQMLAHGITSAGMFFLVGVIYDRAHHRDLNRFRGLYEPMPLYGGISAIIFFAAMGLPGMCGFVGEFMVVLGTWNYSKLFSILSALTVVLTAAYILWTLQRVYLGQNPAYKEYSDMSLREILCAVPLVVFAILLGVLPSLVLYWLEPSVTGLIDAIAMVTR
jgi:NADH-quinone oxidoreductase subunit M